MTKFLVARLGALVLALLAPIVANATLTVTPITFNIVGLDSNTPASGPKFFPVGVRVCSDVATSNVTAAWTWDPASVNPNINLRAGSLASIIIPSIAAGPAGCRDAYFEVEITQVAAAFDTTRRYHVAATDGSGTFLSPIPREIYVEHLISQSRNSVTGIKLDGVPVPAGSSVGLVLGNTYTIELDSGTATQGYNQFESFINFSNAIFQIQSVVSAYSADNSPYVPGPAPITSDKLYADACLWENNPASPNYRSCVGGDFKAGGSTITTTYVVKIIGGGGSSQTLSTLLYDFSGSSYHYNSDFSVSSFIANIVDPTALTFAKAFSPSPAVAGGTSTLTFTIGNPNAAAIGGANFTDNLPLLGASQMVVATPAVFSTSGCGAATFAPVAGASSISFSNGTIAANSSCTLSVRVALPALPTSGTYANVSGNLFVGALDTGHNASANLALASVAPPASTCGLTLANWTIPNGTTANPPDLVGGIPTVKAANVSTATLAALIPASAAILTSSGQNDTTSWQTFGYKDAGQYIEFVVDTRNYTAVQMSFYLGNPSPANGPTSVVLSYDNGSGFNNILTIPAPAAAFTLHSVDFTGLTSTTGSTTFRIIATGAKNNSSGASLNYDDIAFSGCSTPLPQTLTKAFSPNPIGVNGTSTLTFAITNPNTTSLTGATFTDSLPAGVQVAAVPAATTTCGGSPTWAPAGGSTSLTFGQPTGATLAASASCTVSVNVTATTAGPHTNVSDFVSSTEGGTNTSATGSAVATLTALQPPSVTKTFSTSPILTGATSLLTVTIQNPNSGDALGGVAVADAYPAGLTNANPLVPAVTNTCGGAVIAASGGNGMSLSGGSIAAGGSCSITVPVTSAIAGTYVNVTGPVTAAIAGSGNTANATLVVNAPNPSISLAKRISTSASGPWVLFLAVANGTPLYYEFVVENTGDQPLLPFSVSDPTLAGTGADPASCVWQSPNVPPTLPTLPVASATVDPTATCVTGPIAAVLGNVTNTATAHGTFAGLSYNSAPAQASYLGAVPGFNLVKEISDASVGPWASAVGVAAGANVFYKFTIVNTGPLVLSSIGVADLQVSTASCTFIDPLLVGQATSCIVGPVVASGASGSTTPNTAIAHGTNGGTIFTPPSTASYTIAAANADLAITKTDGVTNVNAGGSTTYTLTVTNNGPAEVTGATVVDSAPAGLTFGAWTCVVTNAGSGGVVTTACGAASGSGNINTTVTMKVGAIITYTVPATVAGGATGTLVNTATVTVPSGTFDPTPVNDSASDSDTVDAIADVSMVKTLVTLGPYTIAQSISYTLVVANAGPSTATNVQVTDAPTNLTITNVSGGGCAALPCTLASLASGANVTITVTATINTAGAFDNSATATATEPDPNPSNNTDNTGNGGVAAASADVSIVKSLITAGPYLAGQSLTYTLFVANAGPSTATSIQVTDVPTNLTITNVSGGGCAALPCTIGSLASGANATITVTATINAAGAFDNSATANAAESDPNPANNIDNTGNGGVAAASADVSMVKTLVTAGPFVAGQSIQYTLFVANAGPSTATSVQITDTPTNLTITNVSGPCAVLPCTLASIAAGGSVTLTVTATINAAGAFDNSATATATESDPNPANNVDNTGNGGVAAASADVSIVKTLVTAGPYLAGQSLTYTLFVANAGPSTATNIQVIDTPTNLSITNVSGGGCAALPCTIASLASGANATITVTATIIATGAFDNTATANAAESDPNPANNIDNTGNGGVAGSQADLSVTKTDGTASVAAGANTTYTITVTNAGPNAAVNATVSDPLPAGMTFVSVSSPGGWGCVTPAVGAGGTITCSNGSMAVGSAVFTLVANVGAAVPVGTTLSNTATVSSTTVDPTPGNNSATDSDLVTPALADLAISKTDGVSSLAPGALTTYTITVTNNGPAEVTGATVTDLAPGFLTINNWTCAVSNPGSGGVVVSACGSASGSGNINATVTLKVGAVITFTVPATVAANATGTITNIATVNVPAGVSDPTPGNNSASDSDAISSAPPVNVVPVPTLGPLGLGLLMLLLGALSARYLRTRRVSRSR